MYRDEYIHTLFNDKYSKQEYMYKSVWKIM